VGTYQVKSGETLYGIALKFKLTVAQLKALNGLTSDTVSIGQVLKVVGSAPTPSPSPQPVPAPNSIVPYPGHLLQLGSKGIDVERLQRALGIAVDGSFGPATQSAVKAYQSRHGLSADGIVGSATWNTIF
jgi:peptidoglycan hydrolase-like protein with peptidoglycan-binding domain